MEFLHAHPWFMIDDPINQNSHKHVVVDEADWLKAKSLNAQNIALLAELKAVDDALGTNEGHSAVKHIADLIRERDQYKKYWEIEMIKAGMNADDLVKNGWKP